MEAHRYGPGPEIRSLRLTASLSFTPQASKCAIFGPSPRSYSNARPGQRGANAPRQGQRGANAPRPAQRGANARRPAQRVANARRPAQRSANARRPAQRGANARRPAQRGANARRPAHVGDSCSPAYWMPKEPSSRDAKPAPPPSPTSRPNAASLSAEFRACMPGKGWISSVSQDGVYTCKHCQGWVT
eukprot:jgi/Tetstr1/442371/TSEL_030497.t1